MEDWWDAPERHLRSDWAPSQGFKNASRMGESVVPLQNPADEKLRERTSRVPLLKS